MNVMRYILMIILSIGNQAVYAQGRGAIEGTVTDENGEPVIGARIEVFCGGLKKGASITDIDGNYIVKPLMAGSYQLTSSYTTYKSIRVTGINVSNDVVVKVIVIFDPNALEEKVIVYQKPLISSTGKVNNSFVTDDLNKLNMGNRYPDVLIPTFKRNISGKVQTKHDKPIIGAWVELYQDDTRIQLVRTDTNGYYYFGNLKDGTYKVSLYHWQFEDMHVEEIQILNGDACTVDLNLRKRGGERTIKYKKQEKKGATLSHDDNHSNSYKNEAIQKQAVGSKSDSTVVLDGYMPRGGTPVITISYCSEGSKEKKHFLNFLRKKKNR